MTTKASMHFTPNHASHPRSLGWCLRLSSDSSGATCSERCVGLPEDLDLGQATLDVPISSGPEHTLLLPQR